uniref:Lipase domain-containing protein n=1 Tax=Timema douglasi TaxID=61478 RepID=A0A7R8VH19_TIMDO|nr:unnamed protein product [Timema douglasi]
MTERSEFKPREKPITPRLVNDSVANLNVSKQTVIVIHGFTHGFTGSGKAASVTLIRDASLFVQDVNMVVMDWGILAKGPWYEQAVNNTGKAAVALARFIEALFNEGLSPERLTIVGFSLGAQVAGLAAGKLRTATRLKRIVGAQVAGLAAGKLRTATRLKRIVVVGFILRVQRAVIMVEQLRTTTHFKRIVDKCHHFKTILCTICLTDVGFSIEPRVAGVAAGHLWGYHQSQETRLDAARPIGQRTLGPIRYQVHVNLLQTLFPGLDAARPMFHRLDAARPMFDRRPPKDRLDPEDAEFVMSIHTAGDFLAFYDPIGHADFYPNGGKSPQPTCQDDELKMICSHFMAPLLFVESIYSADAFLATRCDSWQAYRNKSCVGQEKVIMGLNTPSTARGKFYLDTNLTPPYGRNSNPSIPLNEPSMMMVSDDDEDLENIEVKKHPKPTPTDTKTGSNPDVGVFHSAATVTIGTEPFRRTWTGVHECYSGLLGHPTKTRPSPPMSYLGKTPSPSLGPDEGRSWPLLVIAQSQGGQELSLRTVASSVLLTAPSCAHCPKLGLPPLQDLLYETNRPKLPSGDLVEMS